MTVFNPTLQHPFIRKYLLIIGLIFIPFFMGIDSALNPGLTFSLIVVFLYALLCFYDLRNSYIVLVFLIPIIPNSLIIDLGSGSSRIFLYRLFVFICFAAFATSLFLRKINLDWTAYHKVGLVFIASMIINVMFSAKPLTSLKTMVAELWLSGLLFFFVSFHLTDNEETFKKLLYAAIGAAFLVSLMGFYEFLTGNSIEQSALVSYLTPLKGDITIGDWGRGLAVRGGLYRAQATMFHPLGMASYLLFIFPLLYEYASNGRGRWLWFFTIAGGLGTTLSRAGWFIATAFVGIRMRKNLILTGILLGVTIFVIIPWYQTHGQEGSNMLMAGNTDVARFMRIDSAINVFKSHPLTGVGVGHLDLDIFKNVQYRSWDVTLACLLEENGIIGVSIWLFFFLYLVVRFYKLSHRKEFHLEWAADGLLLGIIASLFNATFSNSIFQFSQGYLVMMALLGSMARIEWKYRINEKTNTAIDSRLSS